MSYVGSFPLRKGDRLVLKLDGVTEEGTVVGRQAHRVEAKGEFGRMVLSLVGDGDDRSLTIGVSRQDSEGRELIVE